MLWAAFAKNAEKVVISRFPAEFVHVTTYKQIAHGLFPLQFSRFSFALGGFCQTAEKVAVSILSMGIFLANFKSNEKHVFYWVHDVWCGGGSC